MKALGRIIAAGGAGALVVLGSVQGTANAAGHDVYSVFSPRGIALARFESYGEKFIIFDGTCTDHITARLQYKVGSGGSVSTYEVTCSNPNDDVASRTINESWAENTKIYFRACNSGAASGCSDWVPATA